MKTAWSSDTITRETVRAAATDPAHQFVTALGLMSFDAVGDTSLKLTSAYRLDDPGRLELELQGAARHRSPHGPVGSSPPPS
jgi:hypothetical protein